MPRKVVKGPRKAVFVCKGTLKIDPIMKVKFSPVMITAEPLTSSPFAKPVRLAIKKLNLTFPGSVLLLVTPTVICTPSFSGVSPCDLLHLV